MYIMLYMFGYKVGAWFYCIEVCYNILYYFLHVLFIISSIILKLLIFCKYN